jgi:hypothetical protein
MFPAKGCDPAGAPFWQQMSQDLQLLGRSKRTHDGYLREVRKLACFYDTSPDQLTQQQVADYLLYLINDKAFAPGSLNVAYSGIKFFMLRGDQNQNANGTLEIQNGLLEQSV